ncbi:hypothetical protein GCM10011491_27410 [Brucella endophytica]|uniref:DUF2065 domain-containing protein n=1 Tax=Brucella endophytica TaxID=1963359 RepID=A0A916SHF8_9HYPH|nr:DUF2065 family protein [Brucella endophytica]GGA97672.1 hypothetical protein GCM10011491_27410 [Brucella endophytica]
MNDFVAAIGLLFVFEGLLYGGFPLLAKRFARDVADMPDSVLRVAGILAIAAGVAIVWLARG